MKLFNRKPEPKFETKFMIFAKINWYDDEVTKAITKVETITYILREDQYGNRTFRVEDYGSAKIMEKWKSMDIYIHTIVPWLNGLDQGLTSFYEKFKDEPDIIVASDTIRSDYLKLLKDIDENPVLKEKWEEFQTMRKLINSEEFPKKK